MSKKGIRGSRNAFSPTREKINEAFSGERVCSYCLKELLLTERKRCPCHTRENPVRYCDEVCQKLDWDESGGHKIGHKYVCPYRGWKRKQLVQQTADLLWQESF